MKAKLFTAILLAATMLAPASARASLADELAIRQVALRLSDTVTAYRGRGWQVHDFDSAFVQRGAYVDYSVPLCVGNQMVFRGLGDADARNITLQVFDPSGRLVVRDNDSDATPYVSFRVPRSGNYTVRLSLPECVANGSYCVLLVAIK